MNSQTDIATGISQDENILSKKLSKAAETKSSRTLTTLGVVSLLLGILGLIALVGISLTKTQSTIDKIKIEDIDPEVANELSRQVVYSSEEETIDYYSPKLDALITYSTSIFQLSEGYDNILISPKGTNLEIYASLNVDAKDLYTDIAQVYIDKYTAIYDNIEVLSNETDKDGLITVALKYSKPSIIQDETETIFRKILILELKDSFAVMDISETGKQSLTDKYLDEYTQILQSIELNPPNIEPEIIVDVPVGNVQVILDRKKWTVSTQNEYSLSTTFISNEYEKDEDLKWSITSFFLNTYETNVERDASYFKDILLRDLERNEDQYSDRKFHTIEDDGETTIGNIQFYYIKYEYEKLWGEKDVVTLYSAYNPGTASVINITTHQPPGKSEGGTELAAVLQKITIDSKESNSDEDTEESSLGPNLNVLGTSTIEIEKSALIGKPAVVHIFNRSCANITVSQSSELPYTSGKTYELCTAGFGSGFYVNDDGYIITNAHVAALDSTDIVVDGMLFGYDPDGFGTALMLDTMTVLSELDPDFEDNVDFNNPEYQDLIMGSMVVLIVDGINNDYMTIGDTTYTNYAQKDTPFSVDNYILDIKDKDQHMETDLIGKRNIESIYQTAVSEMKEESTGITTPDLALLKVKSYDMETCSAIRLSDPEKMNVGQSVYVFGFPGSAENETIFAADSTMIPTITRGTISAIKPNFNSSFDLVQIDASISHGNSGGPILNTDGHLVGVATYGIGTEETSADFNAGVSVTEVAKLLKDNNVSSDPGPVTELVESGIDNFAKEYYKWALDDFNEAKTLSNSVSDVLDPLVKITEEKIAQGEDNTPIIVIGDLNLHKTDLIIAAIVSVLIVIGILVLVLILVMKIRRTRKESKASDLETPSLGTPLAASPIPPTAPVSPISPMSPTPTTPIVSIDSKTPTVSSKPISTTPIENSSETSLMGSPAPTQVPTPSPVPTTTPIQPSIQQDPAQAPVQTQTPVSDLPQPRVTPSSTMLSPGQLPGSPLPQNLTPAGELSPMNGIVKPDIHVGNTVPGSTVQTTTVPKSLTGTKQPATPTTPTQTVPPAQTVTPNQTVQPTIPTQPIQTITTDQPVSPTNITLPDNPPTIAST